MPSLRNVDAERARADLTAQYNNIPEVGQSFNDAAH